jgi:hypothetical protein
MEIGGGACRLALAELESNALFRFDEREKPFVPKGHFRRFSISALSLHFSMTWK